MSTIKRQIENKILLGFIGAAFFLAFVAIGAWQTAHQCAEAFEQVDHTHRLFNRLEHTLTSALEAESLSRGYLLSGKESFLTAYRVECTSLGESMSELEREMWQEPAQRSRIKQLSTLVFHRLAMADEVIALKRDGQTDKAIQRVSTEEGKHATEKIREIVREIVGEESLFLQHRSTLAQNLALGMVSFAVSGGVFAITIVAFSGFLVRRDFRLRRHAEVERDRYFFLSPDLLCVFNSTGFFTRVNPAFEQALGWNEQELLASPYIDFVHPDDRAAAQRMQDQLLFGGEHMLLFDNRYRHKDGSWRTLSWRATSRPDGHIYAVAQEVTENRKMEQALRNSEENLAVTLQSIGDAVLATDAHACVTRMNPVAEALTGWTQKEAVGARVEDVLRLVDETKREPLQLPVERVLKTGSVHEWAAPTLLVDRRGGEHPITECAAPIRDRQNSVVGVVLVFRDVTEERRSRRLLEDSERRLRQLNEELEQRVESRTEELRTSERLAQASLDAIDHHVAILDERGVIVATNRPWREFAVRNGLSAAGSDVGVNYLQICDRCLDTTVSAARMAAVIRAAIAGRTEPSMFEYECHSSGEQRWFVARVTRLTGGTSVRVMVSHENITGMKLRERAQLRAQRLECLGTLAGGVAHDLNNALAPILMGLETLSEQHPKDAELIETLRTSAQRGAEMVRHLLTFARGIEGAFDPVDIGALVREIQKLVQSSFPKNILLTVAYDPDLPKVMGNATQLHQVLLNLVVNARDAMPSGGMLTIDASNVTLDASDAVVSSDLQPGKYVAVRVGDTGSGIPPEIVDRIFDPFFTTKSPDKGTGLGLSTATGIVKKHGGYLTVDSQVNQGSTFVLYLPVTDEAPSSCSPHQIAQKGVLAGHGECILIVDDDAAMRNVTATVLKKMGFETILAADGIQALVKVTELWNGLMAVITDIHMPRKDGLAFVEALRRVLPNLPVVVMSGNDERTAREQFDALGVTTWLDKPFSERQLIDALAHVLQSQNNHLTDD